MVGPGRSFSTPCGSKPPTEHRPLSCLGGPSESEIAMSDCSFDNLRTVKKPGKPGFFTVSMEKIILHHAAPRLPESDHSSDRPRIAAISDRDNTQTRIAHLSMHRRLWERLRAVPPDTPDCALCVHIVESRKDQRNPHRGSRSPGRGRDHSRPARGRPCAMNNRACHHSSRPRETAPGWIDDCP